MPFADSERRKVVDSVEVIHAVLTLPGTPLHALAGDRVWARTAPSVAQWQNDAPAVIFRPQSEKFHSVYFDGRYQFRCFGGTPQDADARAVYRALLETLDRRWLTTAAGHGLMTADHETVTQDVIDPDTGWPYVMAIFDIRVT